MTDAPIIVEHSKRTDAAYDGPAVVYMIDPKALKLKKMGPPRFTPDMAVRLGLQHNLHFDKA